MRLMDKIGIIATCFLCFLIIPGTSSFQVTVSVTSTSLTTAALTWLTSCNSTNSSITFNVTVVGVNDQYFISNYSISFLTDNYSVVLTNLQSYKAYMVSVCSTIKNQSNACGATSFRTLSQWPPGAVTISSATGAGSTISVTWSAPSYPYNYVWYYLVIACESGSSSSGCTVVNATGSATQASVLGLFHCTVYNLNVTAINNAGSGQPANASVPTYPTWNGTNGGIQLWGGSLNTSYYEGTLIEYNSNPYWWGYFWQWSSICPVNFTNIDAQVACNSLCGSKGRYFYGSVLRSSEQSNSNSTSLYISNVQCVGTETAFSSCPQTLASYYSIPTCGDLDPVYLRCFTSTAGLTPVNKYVTSPRVNESVICGNATVTVRVAAWQVLNGAASNVYPTPVPNCSNASYGYSSSSIVLVIPFGSCGTTVKSDSYTTYYTLEVTVILSQWLGSVQPSYSVQTSCSLYRVASVGLGQSNTNTGSSSIFVQMLDGALSMSLYYDMALTSLVSSTSPLTIGTTVFMKVSLENSTDTTRTMYITNCSAQPSKTDSTSTLSLISNACPVSTTTQFIPSSSTTQSVVFSFQTFGFLVSNTEIFVSCAIVMCKADDTSTPLCTQSCNSQQHLSNRKRRSIELAAKLSTGSIVAAKSSAQFSSTASISQLPIFVENPFQGLTIVCNGNCTFTDNGLLYKVINGVVFLVGKETSIGSYVSLTTPINGVTSSSSGLSALIIMEIVLSAAACIKCYI